MPDSSRSQILLSGFIGSQGLNAPVNPSANFSQNFRAFYLELLRIKNEGVEKTGKDIAWAPDIDLFSWRNNNLPDWDFWRYRYRRQEIDPNFRLSRWGIIWRLMGTSKLPNQLDDLGGKNHAFFRIPVIGWYIYWLIHNPNQKGLGPFNEKVRRSSMERYIDRKVEESENLSDDQVPDYEIGIIIFSFLYPVFYIVN